MMVTHPAPWYRPQWPCCSSSVPSIHGPAVSMQRSPPCSVAQPSWSTPLLCRVPHEDYRNYLQTSKKLVYDTTTEITSSREKEISFFFFFFFFRCSCWLLLLYEVLPPTHPPTEHTHTHTKYRAGLGAVFINFNHVLCQSTELRKTFLAIKQTPIYQVTSSV